MRHAITYGATRRTIAGGFVRRKESREARHDDFGFVRRWHSHPEPIGFARWFTLSGLGSLGTIVPRQFGFASSPFDAASSCQPGRFPPKSDRTGTERNRGFVWASGSSTPAVAVGLMGRQSLASVGRIIVRTNWLRSALGCVRVGFDGSMLGRFLSGVTPEAPGTLNGIVKELSSSSRIPRISSLESGVFATTLAVHRVGESYGCVGQSRGFEPIGES